jgi:PEP-CTERM motif
MKTQRTYFGNYASGILLLGAVATAHAQSTWNYFISDAGGGNSLLTWSVSGSLATPPGAVLVSSESSIAVSINAPGLYADSYLASAAPQSIPTPDGSYFQLDNTSIYTAIVAYDAYNAPGSGNDSFGLASSTLLPHQGDPGHALLYNPGTQSVLIPIDYSNFNPGFYESEQSGFNTPVTVNLTVGPVPEPSPLALISAGGLCGLLLRRRTPTRKEEYEQECTREV